jgi:hypothetical protein
LKILLLGLATTLFISGCATKNAFSKLNMGTEQEVAVENTRCAKLITEDSVGGIFSAVYLNNIYKDMDQKTQNFYISTYIKKSDIDLDIKLNGKKPLTITKLPSLNKYSHLLSTSNEWTKNYEVIFMKTKSSNINLSIDSGQFSSGLLKYSKDLQ